MLKLARFRGPGSFKPRNDGPLITGGASVSGAAVRCGICDVVEAEGADAAGVETIVGLCAEGGAGAWAGGNSVPPHMPQKRFSSEFSLPQRGQRTGPPGLSRFSL